MWILTPFQPYVPWLAAFALAAFGVWDQTHRGWFRDHLSQYTTIQNRWKYDQSRFEGAPSGPVFCLPLIPYPETLKVGQLSGYDHVRGYLHSPTTTSWSFGAMKGREADLWQREIVRLPVDAMLDRLVYRGFNGVLLDFRGVSSHEAVVLMRGFLDHGLCSTAPMAWEFVLPLASHRQGLIERLGQAEFDRRCEAERKRVSVLWLQGFVSFNPPGEENKHRWCGRRGTAVIVNPSDVTRTFNVSMVLRSSPGEHGQLTIDGGEVWSETLQLIDGSPQIARTWTVPPGRHTILFNFAPMREHVPKDARDNVFFIACFAMKEVADSR